MKSKRFYYLLIGSIILNLLTGCSGSGRAPLTQKSAIDQQSDSIVLLPSFAEVHLIENSKFDDSDSMWEETLKVNIQESLKQNIKKLGLKYSAPDIESLSDAEKTSLADAYIEFNATEKELIHLLNVKNDVGEVSLGSHLLPQGMQYPGVSGDKALFCKATDAYSSGAMETIKNTAIVTVGIIVIAGVIVFAPEKLLLSPKKNRPEVRHNYTLGPRFISCTLADLHSHKILWYNAEEIQGDSKSYKSIDIALGNILKDFPLKASY